MIPVCPGCGMGTKVEIKNLNSFKAVRDATRYEAERQIAWFVAHPCFCRS